MNNKTDNNKTDNNINAYEIRLNILKMAHDDCIDVFNTKYNIYRDSKTESINLINQYPKPEDIIQRANALYKFICTK